MSDQRNPAFLWDKSMRIGLPKFDEERKTLTNIIELLDLSPLHRITSEFFLLRFGIFKAAVEAFFKHEEALLREYHVPEGIRNAHTSEHAKILEMLNGVYVDSNNRRNYTALDEYTAIRNSLKQHIIDYGLDLKEYISTQEPEPYNPDSMDSST